MDLFADDTALAAIPIEDGELWFQQRLTLDLAPAEVMQRLLEETDWRAEEIQVWGKLHMQPRLSAWHGEASYTLFRPAPRTAAVHAAACTSSSRRKRHRPALQQRAAELLSQRARQHGHAQRRRAELGPEPAIASLSYGATRSFILRHKRSRRPSNSSWATAACC
jgi:alkylated DNA repair dioxygenase AlkB